MHKLTFYPLGNADCCRIELECGSQFLFDYADVKCYNDPNDKRIALRKRLLADLNGRKHFEVVAFTHLDDDHVRGSSDFFHFRHAQMYQGDDRVEIDELWVPAAAIIESGLEDCARIIREEAKHRLIEGRGIRVFSRPDLLHDWLTERGISPESRAHLISDAGTVVPGWSKSLHGVELFVHSPFASRVNEYEVVDRNKDCIVLHGTFIVNGVETKVLFGGDIEHESLEEVVRITRYHGRDERLECDIVKIPHHCSYLSLSSEKGQERTRPSDNIAYLYEQKVKREAILVSTSWPVSGDDSDNQPPHRQAKKYYLDQVRTYGLFEVTMEHPRESAPEPLVIVIDEKRGTVKRSYAVGASMAASTRAPRAGA